jgi:hypothetical protein
MFNERLASRMRTQTLDSLKAQGIDVVAPSTEQTRQGCVESREEAETCSLNAASTQATTAPRSD